jgi:hypothetical protein
VVERTQTGVFVMESETHCALEIPGAQRRSNDAKNRRIRIKKQQEKVETRSEISGDQAMISFFSEYETPVKAKMSPNTRFPLDGAQRDLNLFRQHRKHCLDADDAGHTLMLE